MNISSYLVMFSLMGSDIATPTTPNIEVVHTAQAMTIPEAVNKLKQQGYYDIRRVTVDRKNDEIVFRVKDTSNMRVTVIMDLYSGEILGR